MEEIASTQQIVVPYNSSIVSAAIYTFICHGVGSRRVLCASVGS